MSITFYIAKRMPEALGGGTRYVYRCDCSERWCAACDEAYLANTDSPAMFSCDDCTDTEVNMANMNAAEWMRWVGITSESCGEIPAKDLAVLCRRRLWDEARNHDPKVTSEEFAKLHGLDGHPRVIFGERAEDYLRSRTAQILRICEKAGDKLIAWA
jgi:hypothetical protein